jgi:putative oxidoreductase
MSRTENTEMFKYKVDQTMSASTTHSRAAAPADALHDTGVLIARLFLGAIFVQSGFGKLAGLAGFAAGLTKMGVPMASTIAPFAAGVEFVGGLAIVLGAWTVFAAALMIAFTAVGSFLAHRFWAAPAEQYALQNVQFMKNVAIIGGFLAVLLSGPGRISLDYLLRRR